METRRWTAASLRYGAKSRNYDVHVRLKVLLLALLLATAKPAVLNEVTPGFAPSLGHEPIHSLRGWSWMVALKPDSPPAALIAMLFSESHTRLRISISAGAEGAGAHK